MGGAGGVGALTLKRKVQLNRHTRYVPTGTSSLQLCIRMIAKTQITPLADTPRCRAEPEVGCELTCVD